MKRSHSLVLSLLVTLLTACGANPRAEDAQASRRDGNANVITAEEIQAAARSQHAYDLIRSMRPNWLQSRGVQSLGRPVVGGGGAHERQPTGGMMHQAVVYVDGTRAGGLDILRQILASDLREVRFLGATEATARYGADHGGGAILVTLRHR